MRHSDAVAMLAGGHLSEPAPGVWADLGCGDGTFTAALGDLLAAGSTIHAMDHSAGALRRLPRSIAGVRVEPHLHDFTVFPWPVDTALDGILLANSLHFVAAHRPFLRACADRLTDRGRFLIVEYDTDRGNRWVPCPISFATLQGYVASFGFDDCRRLSTRPSIYQQSALYSAVVGRSSPTYADLAPDHGETPRKNSNVRTDEQ